jgi:hypothetical protein
MVSDAPALFAWADGAPPTDTPVIKAADVASAGVVVIPAETTKRRGRQKGDT